MSWFEVVLDPWSLTYLAWAIILGFAVYLSGYELWVQSDLLGKIVVFGVSAVWTCIAAYLYLHVIVRGVIQTPNGGAG